MLQALTPQELRMAQLMRNPIALGEVLFSDFENLRLDEEEQLGKFRLYQYPMLSFEYMLAPNTQLSKKENFKRRINSGTVYNFAARKIGKTVVSEMLDMIIASISYPGEDAIFSSYDAIHIRKVLDKVIDCFQNNKILKFFYKSATRNPNYKINLNNGYVIYGVNQNVSSKNPGAQVFGHHVKRLYFEEFSKTPEEVFTKFVDAVSEYGAVTLASGMMDFSVHSPAGKIFTDIKNRRKIVNFPQFCLAENTKILMEDLSLKNIQDVNIGDKILSFSEKQPHVLEVSEVLNKSFSGVKDTVMLDGRLQLTPNHKVLIRRGGSDKYFKEASKITNKDAVYITNNFCTYNKDYYWGLFLGFLDTEAHARDNYFEFFQKDEVKCVEWLLKFLDIKYTAYPDSGDTNFNRYYIKVENFLLIEEKKLLLNNCIEAQFGYLAGCIIADGCVNWYVDGKRKKLQLVITQKNKIKEIENILHKTRLKYSKQKHSDPGTFVYLIPRFELPFFIPFSKKVQKYSQALVGSTLKSFGKKIVNIEKSFKVGVWDLTTSNHTIIANGVIVHNCNPNWDEDTKKKTIQEYGGESSASYKVFCLGELVESGLTVFDMVRIRNLYDENKLVKHFEVDKDSFYRFKEILILDVPEQVEGVYIGCDVGETAATEFAIFFKIGNNYKFVYNITAYRLTHRELFELSFYILVTLKAKMISIDSTDALGRFLVRELQERFDKHQIVSCAFNEKLAIDYERDDKGNLIFQDGKMVEKMEFISEWSVKILKDLLYENIVHLPLYHKLDEQLNSVICIKNNNGRISYETLGQEDHLFAAFRCFAIGYWLTLFKTLRPMTQKKFFKGMV